MEVNPFLRFFVQKFWAKLPGTIQARVSRFHSFLYETKISRHFIVPYARLNYESAAELNRFKPGSGSKHYQNFQDFFIRQFTQEPSVNSAQIWPCEGLLCESGHVNSDFLVSVKGERRHISAVFGPEFEVPHGSHFTNVFLHNSDYHRIHAPVSGQVDKIIRIPGDLQFLRPWLYNESPTVPAMTNERVNIQIGCGNGNVWLLSIVGGPGVATIKLVDQLQAGSKITIGQELGFFMMGSTCCMVSPIAPTAIVGVKVHVGMDF